MPFHVWHLLICSCFVVISILHIILHGLMFVYLFLFLILHGVCIIRIMGYILVWGLILLFMYHHLCLYFLLSLWYVFLHFFFFHLHVMFCVPVSSFTYAPGFTYPICVSFIHAWMKTFGGVYAYVFHHMQLYVHFEICILNILYYI